MTATHEHDLRESLVGPARDALTGSARGLTRLLGSAGTGAVSATPASVRSLLANLLTSLDQLPSATDELEVVIAEVHAQRLSLQAMQAQLGVLDAQLEVLERSLAPLSAVNHQIGRLRATLDNLLVDTQDCSGETGAQRRSSAGPDSEQHVERRNRQEE